MNKSALGMMNVSLSCHYEHIHVRHVLQGSVETVVRRGGQSVAVLLQRTVGICLPKILST